MDTIGVYIKTSNEITQKLTALLNTQPRIDEIDVLVRTITKQRLEETQRLQHARDLAKPCESQAIAKMVTQLSESVQLNKDLANHALTHITDQLKKKADADVLQLTQYVDEPQNAEEAIDGLLEHEHQAQKLMQSLQDVPEISAFSPEFLKQIQRIDELALTAKARWRDYQGGLATAERARATAETAATEAKIKLQALQAQLKDAERAQAAAAEEATAVQQALQAKLEATEHAQAAAAEKATAVQQALQAKLEATERAQAAAAAAVDAEPKKAKPSAASKSATAEIAQPPSASHTQLVQLYIPPRQRVQILSILIVTVILQQLLQFALNRK